MLIIIRSFEDLIGSNLFTFTNYIFILVRVFSYISIIGTKLIQKIIAWVNVICGGKPRLYERARARALKFGAIRY